MECRLRCCLFCQLPLIVEVVTRAFVRVAGKDVPEFDWKILRDSRGRFVEALSEELSRHWMNCQDIHRNLIEEVLVRGSSELAVRAFSRCVKNICSVRY